MTHNLKAEQKSGEHGIDDFVIQVMAGNVIYMYIFHSGEILLLL